MINLIPWLKSVKIVSVSEIKLLIYGLSCNLKMAATMKRPTLCKTKLFFPAFFLRWTGIFISWVYIIFKYFTKGTLYFYTFGQTEPKLTQLVENNQR